MTVIQQAIREKQQTLRRIYGGMMTLKDLADELGYRDEKSARKWVKEVQLQATLIGRRKRYDTDTVAKKLTELAGMY